MRGVVVRDQQEVKQRDRPSAKLLITVLNLTKWEASNGKTGKSSRQNQQERQFV